MNRRLCTLAMLALIAAPAVAQDSGDDADVSPRAAYIDGIVAVVNEGVVLQSELNDQTDVIVARLRGQNVAMPPEDVLKDQILDQLILQRLQLQRAERFDIRISDEMLNTALSRVAANSGITINELPNALAAEGIDYGEYRKQVREQMMLEQLRQIDVINRISVSPREVEQCLARQIGSINVNAEYDLNHILIGVPEAATADQFNAAEQEARDVRQRIVDGAPFAELAVSHSDAQTALEGGALGWRRGDQIPTFFTEVVADMSAGDVSEPIRTSSGFHIVQLNDVRGIVGKSEVDQIHVRHILVETNEVIDDQTARQRLSDARREIVDGKPFEDVARLISDDPGSATSGGDLGWASAGTYVPVFEQVANSLDTGELSEPFKSPFGWHVLEVLDRRVYDNTEEVRERNCALSIRNSRVEDETEIWLRRLRDEAFVEKRI